MRAFITLLVASRPRRCFKVKLSVSTALLWNESDRIESISRRFDLFVRPLLLQRQIHQKHAFVSSFQYISIIIIFTMKRTAGGGEGGVRLTMSGKVISIVAVATLILRQFLSAVQFDSTFFPSVDDTVVPLNETTTITTENDNRIRLIHVMNAYSIPSNDNAATTTKAVSPFDQWTAMESIQRAKRYAPPELEVDFVCAMFEEDRLALPNLPCRTVPLTRSTASEYPFLNAHNKTAKVLPFLQDILNAAMLPQKGHGSYGDNDNNVFVILTNSDIAVTKYFYQMIWPHLTTREAFSINRLTIPTDGINQTTIATTNAHGDKLLSQVDAILDQGEMHTGYDCFIMHSSVLRRFHLGDMFAGHPPWGTAMHITLKILARKYINIPSNINGTFHLGNDRSNWFPKGKEKQQESFSDIDKQMNMIDECPAKSFGNHPYTLLNTINCGKWFRYNRFYDNHTIPSFVQAGYENMYLRNYPKALRYSLPNGLGLPSVRSKEEAEKKPMAEAKVKLSHKK